MTVAAETGKHEWVSLTDCDDSLKEEILAESQYILSHPSFRNSRRCVTLFKYLMECFFKGDQESLKERVLGVAVFGRDPSYDSNSDPIVRIAANEIRKRMAQCYQEEHQSRIRIHLLPGSYSPQVEIIKNDVEAPPVEPLSQDSETPAEDKGTGIERKSESHTILDKKAKSVIFLSILGLGLLSACFVALVSRGPQFRSTQELIWAPLLHSTSEPLLMCVSDTRDDPDTGYNNWAEMDANIIATHTIPPLRLKDKRVPAMSVVDAKVAAGLMVAISSQRHRAIMRGSSTVTLADLRQTPDVVIGAFDNPWSLILLSRLRFHVMVDPVTQDEWIEDSQNPGRKEWRGNGSLQFADSSVDYALISRYHSPDTGKWILAVGGLGMHGTEAAGELLTSPIWINTIPKNLIDKENNFQIIVKTTVINGNIGPPQIIAHYSW